MGKRILVTGVGGAPGFGLVRSLMRLGHEVIGTDCDPLASGLALDGITARTLPPADHPDYAARLLYLCRELRPDGLLSTVEAELPMLGTLQGPLKDLSVCTWLPQPSAAVACGDKALFHEVMTRHGVPTPRSAAPEQIDDLPDGLLVVKTGLSMVSATFDDQAVTSRVRHALEAVGMEGVCCVQGFVTASGVIVTEINARIAGAFPCAEAAGARLVEQTVTGLFGRPVDHDRLAYQPGVYLTKCFETLSLKDRGSR